MGFDDIVEEATNEELQELARDIASNEISADREQRLFELLAESTMEDRQAAAQEKPAIGDVLVNLGLDFRFPDEVEREPPDNGELAQRAIDLLERPDGFAVFLREFTNAGLRGLSDELAMGQTTADQENTLRDLLGSVDDPTVRDAVDDRRPLESVLAGLGMPVPDVEVDFEPEPERPTEREIPPLEPRGRRQADAGARPSPFGGEADKEIADRFFAGNFQKGNAWTAAEQERLSRFEGLDPAEFWRERGEEVWGPVLTREEFVDPRR
jgi:hypothetical protein